MDSSEDLENIFHKYVENHCSPEEFEGLMELLGRQEPDSLLKQLIDERLHSEEERKGEGEELNERLQRRLSTILSNRDVTERNFNRNIRWWWIAAASIILIVGVLAALSIWHNEVSVGQIAKIEPAHDVMPGSNKAVLILSNGTTVPLDSSHSGLLSQQGGSDVVNTTDGMLRYDIAEHKSMIVYNTLSTPNGGQYKLRLPDGTMVWLNNASSIHYPTSFQGNERLVEITGEVYFEVVHNALKPFVVKAGNQIIKDIGTHFNVNAYEGPNSVKTTLLEGSVVVRNNSSSILLQPGQQAEGALDGNIHLRTLEDADNVVAWKNGLFFFDNASIQEVMQQLSKWYDIKVKYKGVPSKRRFKGKIQMNIPLSTVLVNIGEESIRYNIENKTVTIYQ